MRKKLFSSLIVVAIAAVGASLVWAGGDVWKTKPYQQWDQKDIQQVLRQSPWVKMQSVPAIWRSGVSAAGMQSGGDNPNLGAPPGGEGDESGGGGGAGARGSMGGSPRPGGGGGGEGAEGGGMGNGQGPQMATFEVRWNSAQTIREAIARNALLNNKITEGDAAKYVGQTPSDYEIFIGGQDLSPFANVSEDELKAKTFLEAKQSKQKMSPTNVMVQRTEDKKRVTFVMFSFPRQAAGNQPFVTPKDKNVEFTCKLKNFDLRANFDLRKMANEKGPDL